MKIEVGDILEGTVIKVYPRYAILLFDENVTGLLHISEVSNHYIHSFTDFVKVGNIYKVKVIAYDEKGPSMRVSLRALNSSEKRESIVHYNVKEDNISCRVLKEHLPEWIKEENEEKDLQL